MIDLKRYKKAFEDLPEGINEAEVNAEKIERTTLKIKDGKLVGSESSSKTKLFIRVTGEKTGMAYTEKLDEDPYEILDKAFINSKYTMSGKPEVFGKANTVFLKRGERKNSIEDAVIFGGAAENFARKSREVDRVLECVVSICSRELKTINSLGLNSSYESNWVESFINLELQRERSSAVGYAYQSGLSFEEMNAVDMAQRAIADGRTYDGNGIEPCKKESGRYDAVLSGRVMRNIMMTAWRVFSGAAMKAHDTIFCEQPGTAVGSEAFSVINAPYHNMLGQAWLTDSEGIRCESVKIVDNGKLVTPLLNLQSANECGMKSTASAGRIDRMTGTMPIKITTVPAVLYIEPGECNAKEMIEDMGTGFYLTYSLDLFHSVNVASGEFSIPCGGVFYEDGKPVGAVSQMTVAGNLRDLFKSIQKVGRDLDFDDFYLKTYTIGSPSVLVRDLDFSS